MQRGNWSLILNRLLVRSSSTQTLPASVSEKHRRKLTQKALATDPVSAFGGIVAFNRTVDAEAAQEVIKIFTEVIIAPEYDPAALEILRSKKNLRVLRLKREQPARSSNSKQISGGMLVQTADDHKLIRWNSRW